MSSLLNIDAAYGNNEVFMTSNVDEITEGESITISVEVKNMTPDVASVTVISSGAKVDDVSSFTGTDASQGYPDWASSLEFAPGEFQKDFTIVAAKDGVIEEIQEMGEKWRFYAYIFDENDSTISAAPSARRVQVLVNDFVETDTSTPEPVVPAPGGGGGGGSAPSPEPEVIPAASITEAADNIVGTAGNDLFRGLGGNDLISAGAGNDFVNGNKGSDSIYGEDGADFLLGGADADFVTGGRENDWVNGNKGNDEIRGGVGDDVVRGGANDDIIYGGVGNDQVLGDKGNDQLIGGAGIDTFHFTEGFNVIQDFEVGVDSYSTIGIDSLDWTNTSDGALASFNGGSMLFTGVDTAALGI